MQSCATNLTWREPVDKLHQFTVYFVNCLNGKRNLVQTKLTLRIEKELIRKAKRHSRKPGKSVSKMVSDYFNIIDAGGSKQEELTPWVRSLMGVLKDSKLSEDDYHRHLQGKH